MEASGDWSRSGWRARNSWDSGGTEHDHSWNELSSWENSHKNRSTEHDDSWSGSSPHLCGWGDSSAGAAEHSLGDIQESPVGGAIGLALARSTGTRSRSPASARDAEQRYESPWLSFRPARFGRLTELLHNRSQRPVTELEFIHALSGGASEHMARVGNCLSPSTSHHLSTMARSITALIRTRAESNPAWHDILRAVIANAYCVANKRSGREWPRVVQTPHDCLSNRCEYAAILLLLEQALVRGDPLRSEEADDFWRNATDFEHQIAVTLLGQSINNVEAKVRDIKLILGSS